MASLSQVLDAVQTNSTLIASASDLSARVLDEVAKTLETVQETIALLRDQLGSDSEAATTTDQIASSVASQKQSLETVIATLGKISETASAGAPISQSPIVVIPPLQDTVILPEVTSEELIQDGGTDDFDVPVIISPTIDEIGLDGAINVDPDLGDEITA